MTTLTAEQKEQYVPAMLLWGSFIEDAHQSGTRGKRARTAQRELSLKMLLVFPEDRLVLRLVVESLIWTPFSARMTGDCPDHPDFDPLSLADDPQRRALEAQANEEIRKGEEVLQTLVIKWPSTGWEAAGQIATSRAFRFRKVGSSMERGPQRKAQIEQARDFEFDALRAFSEAKNYTAIGRDCTNCHGLSQMIVASRMGAPLTKRRTCKWPRRRDIQPKTLETDTHSSFNCK